MEGGRQAGPAAPQRCGTGAVNLKTAVDADLQVEMPLETDRGVVPAEGGTHAESLF